MTGRHMRVLERSSEVLSHNSVVSMMQPIQGWDAPAMFSQGSSVLATLIGIPELFIGGEESLGKSPRSRR